MSLSYKQSGVNYDFIDPVKKLAQSEGLKTVLNLTKAGFQEVLASRGESAYIIESNDCYFAFVIEGLGTKNLIADKMRKISGKTYYDMIAQDTVAMIINDLITVGARPLTLSTYWAVGESSWMKDRLRMRDLVKGWKNSCNLADCSWGGGETPVLKDIIDPKTIDLAGSAFGIIKPKGRLILGDKLQAEDIIILLESSGIHANGLTLARQISIKVSDSYSTKLINNRMYGEELLKPTIIYSRLIRTLLDNKVDIHYMINITGHGWRKLMRARQPFTYTINNIPPSHPIFQFIQKHGDLSDEEMYSTFNMGAGFALFVKPKDVDKVLKLSEKFKIKAFRAGIVEKGKKKVVIRPLNIIFNEKDLAIRQP